jgi:cyclopropane-fatty-acyl-phospholipid synthase
VVGVTVSREQQELGQGRCAGLPVELRLCDYRELDERFERIVSVGMFEHVGRRHYDEFFATAERCLAPEGLFLLHTVGYRHEEPINPWYDKYVMPGVEFPTMKNLADAAQRGFVLEHLQTFEGRHYDRTLMSWWQRFEAGWPALCERYGETFFRMWKLYLQGCAGAFRANKMRVWQLVYSKGDLPHGYAYGHRGALA